MSLTTYIARLYGTSKKSVQITPNRSNPPVARKYASANGAAVFTHETGRDDQNRVVSRPGVAGRSGVRTLSSSSSPGPGVPANATSPRPDTVGLPATAPARGRAVSTTQPEGMT